MTILSNGVKGYAEGYYGRLLSWQDRLAVLDRLYANKFNTYYYAPKEDVKHRFHWREPYGESWRHSFREFCAQAKARQIYVVAGIAPGLDFDFAHLPDGADFKALLSKAIQLSNDGAASISLLMDDIDADFDKRCGTFSSEGAAHASLANALGCKLHEAMIFATLNNATKSTPESSAISSGVPLWVTPRIYADELSAEAPGYLPAFVEQLHNHHSLLYCGSDVVARHVNSDLTLAGHIPQHRIIIWDNLYANDYCPRRLFVGPWQGREECENILINPTGHLQTDCLLIDLMAHDENVTALEHWRYVLNRYDVPESFQAIASYFHHPVCNDSPDKQWQAPSAEVYDAIEHCLWRWKSDLSREWYSYLFGLKHDLLLSENKLPHLRIRKTQTQALRKRLMDKSR